MEEGLGLDSRELENGVKPEEAPPEARLRTYILVWLGIILLTGITFILSWTKVTGWEVFIALIIAGTQSALALFYFMHLGTEKAHIFKIIIPVVLAVLLVFMALTFSDVAFRR